MSKPPEIDPLFAQLFDWKPSKAQGKQIQILEAAIETLANHGVEGASLEAIGKRIKMARSHIVYYFATKEELFQKAIEYITANAQRMTVMEIQQAKTPEQRLEKYLSVNFDWAETFPNHARVMGLFYYLCSHRKDYALMHRKMRDVGVERLAAIVSEMVPAVSDLEKVQALALMIQNLITGNIFYALGTNREKDLPRLKAHAWEQCSSLVKNLK